MDVLARDERWTINWTAAEKGRNGGRVANVTGPAVQAGGPVEVVPASQLKGAVSVEDVERILAETSRYFSGDHVHAGVVVREVRKRLRVLAGGR